MRQFAEIAPLTIKQHPNLVASLPDDREKNRTWYFLIIDDYMIIADTDYALSFKTRENKWFHDQIEFPKQGLQWFLDSLRNKFFKTAAEGGLPKGTFHDEATIAGEQLKLGRAFNADGNGGGGYSFITLDRDDEDGFAKEYIFSDALLFEHGLIQLLEDIAAKIAAGQL